MKRLFFAFTLVTGALCAAPVSEVKIRALDGFGGDVSSVATFCKTKAGAQYNAQTVSADVLALSESGNYEQVNADVNETSKGVEVVFYVKRKLTYKAPIVVEGAEAISASKVAAEAGLKDGYRYGQSDIAEVAARVRKMYIKKHFRDAKIAPIVKADEEGVFTLELLVDEGKKKKIKNYVFVGVNSVEESELRNAIGDFPWWNVKGWLADKPVTDDELAESSSKIAKVYKDAGYLDVIVEKPKFMTIKEGAEDVIFKVIEGPLYKVGKVSITGLTRYPEAAVRGKSNVPVAGSAASEKELEEAARRIEVVVGSGDLGLADSHVRIKRIPQKSDPTVVDLVFDVTEGVAVVISSVKIRGNDYTKDMVIRREISLSPGDRMLVDRADTSRKRLENLGYFSRVSYKLEPTGAGKDANGCEYRDLVYEVEEKNTGSFMVGVGASSVDSVYVSAEVSQSNFDIFAPSKFFRGGGQKARVYAQAGPRIQSYEFSITEPHLFGRFLELSVDAYRRNRWYDEYDIIRTGASASLSYPVKFWSTWDPFGRLGFRLSGELIEFDDVEDGEWMFNKKEVSLTDERKLYSDALEPVLRLFWSHDSRNNFRIPTQGSRTQIFADLAPAGDNEYWRIGGIHRHYFDVWQRYHHVLMAGVRFETIDGISDEVPIYNRMFLGGPKSIRGIEYRNVAPFATRENGDSIPWGGQTLFVANLEYTIPVFKMLRIAGFTDFGCVGVDDFDFDFSDNFAWTVGIGIRLDIPMFPIRLDFGVPIEKPDEAEEELFSFTIGYDF